MEFPQANTAVRAVRSLSDIRESLRHFRATCALAAPAGESVRAALDAVRGAAETELRSGPEAAREELGIWLRGLPNSVRPEVEARVKTVLEGMDSPSAWLTGAVA